VDVCGRPVATERLLRHFAWPGRMQGRGLRSGSLRHRKREILQLDPPGRPVSAIGRWHYAHYLLPDTEGNSAVAGGGGYNHPIIVIRVTEGSDRMVKSSVQEAAGTMLARKRGRRRMLFFRVSVQVRHEVPGRGRTWSSSAQGAYVIIDPILHANY